MQILFFSVFNAGAQEEAAHDAVVIIFQHIQLYPPPRQLWNCEKVELENGFRALKYCAVVALQFPNWIMDVRRLQFQALPSVFKLWLLLQQHSTCNIDFERLAFSSHNRFWCNKLALVLYWGRLQPVASKASLPQRNYFHACHSNHNGSSVEKNDVGLQ